jgi:hypothetical protein
MNRLNVITCVSVMLVAPDTLSIRNVGARECSVVA